MLPNLNSGLARTARFASLAILLLLSACSSPEEQAQAHYESALELLETEQPRKARLELLNAVQLNPKLHDAWFNLAKIEERVKNWGQVNIYLQKALDLKPDRFEANLLMARLQTAAGKLDKALVRINAAADKKAGNSDVHAARATILLRLNDRAGARNDAERALALNPDNPEAHAVLAADKMRDGNVPGAMLFIDRGLATDPENHGLLLFKLKILNDTGKFDEAAKILRALIKIEPGNKSLRRGLVKLLTDRNRPAEAEVEMRSLVDAFPDDTATALEFVEFIGNLKGAQAARDELQSLIAQRPNEVTYKLALAQFDFVEKKPDSAIAALQAIISKSEPLKDVQLARVELARLLLRTNKPDRTAELVKQVLAIDEKNVEALTLRADLKLRAGDTDEAIGDLRLALSQQPQSVPLLTMLGRAFENQGAPELAQGRYDQAAELSKFAPDISLRFAQFLTRRGNIQRAETVLASSVVRNPANLNLLRALGKTRLDLKDWLGAQAIAETINKLGDASGSGNEILGSALSGQRKFNQSIAALQSAYEASPEAVRPMVLLFQSYLRTGEAEQAERFVRDVLAANSKNAEARVLLGGLFQMQGNPDEAKAAFKQAIEDEPVNVAGYSALANAFITERNWDDAKTLLDTALKKLPENFNLGLTMALVLEARGDIDETIEVYQKLLKKRPDALIVINNLASLIADNRADQQSLDFASSIVSPIERADVPHFKDTLGWLAYRRGELDKAAGYLEDAVEKLPGLALARYHLAMTYSGLGRANEARDQFAKAKELVKGTGPLAIKIDEGMAVLNSAKKVDQ